MEDRRLESPGDPGHSDDGPRPWQPPSMPDDARALGLDRNTEEGAWVQLASSLDGTKPLHRATAWVLLFVIVGLPVLLRLLNWLHYE
jgi:hypothetical protein